MLCLHRKFCIGAPFFINKFNFTDIRREDFNHRSNLPAFYSCSERSSVHATKSSN